MSDTTRLTAEERETLGTALRADVEAALTGADQAPQLTWAIEAILTARLARVEALADDDALLEDWCTVVQHGGASVDAILRDHLGDFLRAALAASDPQEEGK